ncbi:hypothetical protein SKAU_G00020580 [Synaphobranchus kaupii]|uniref:Uncharacterized protein n=1 Tax=Synaphobranchus kaupii TaxID=118154 RepID=A0A9Q1GCZ7_SYNKA|nr:hypothetical protein SKAU_G00020580 [Synaphobranchus kaupii]
MSGLWTYLGLRAIFKRLPGKRKEKIMQGRSEATTGKADAVRCSVQRPQHCVYGGKSVCLCVGLLNHTGHLGTEGAIFNHGCIPL